MFSFSSALWLFASALVVTNGQAPSPLTVISCGPGSSHSLACDGGVIDVVVARYGPRADTCCSNTGPVGPKCQELNVTESIQERCGAKSTCEVQTEPCSKACNVQCLQTQYKCLPLVRYVKCEDYYFRISCGSGKTIKIVDVFYGRRDRTTCSDDWASRYVKDVTCISAGAPAIVKNKCDGKDKCAFMIHWTLFPNPCPPTAKYMEVNYFCK